jgi:Response regulator receiver domain.
MPTKEVKNVDLILIDDDEMLVDTLSEVFERQGKKVDKYYKPNKFLENLSRYPKDIPICVDNDFKNSINGIELAKKLHTDGFTRLYLFSGKEFGKNEVPPFLTVISKTDLERIYKILE